MSKGTVVSTNQVSKVWQYVFSNAANVVQQIDQRVHHCEILSVEVEPYLLKEAKA